MARGRRGGARRGVAAAALAVGLAALAAAALLGGAAAQCGASCDGCKKRRCKKDGVCFWSGSSCADATDFCAAVQGKKKRRKKCQATISNPALLGSPNCVCSRAKKKCGDCKQPDGPSGDPYLPDNKMVMTGGMLEYEPSDPNGPWTSLCAVAAQARAMDSDAVNNLKDEAGFQKAKAIWDSNAFNKPDFSGTTYFDKTMAFNDNKMNFLDEFFQSGILGAKAGGAGTDDFAARAQIVKKTTQDWVPVTWIMNRLDVLMAELTPTRGAPPGTPTGPPPGTPTGPPPGTPTGPPPGTPTGPPGTATARVAMPHHSATPAQQALFDDIAALWFGCGETNPAPLDKGVKDGWKGLYRPGTEDKRYQAFGPEKWSPSGRATARADNYDVLKDGMTSNGRVKRETAALNFQVIDALNAGPDLTTVRKIQDAVYTTYSQSTLRYAAKLTLLAKLPGNGMGGALNTAAPKEGACGGADASNACCDAKSSNPTCTALRSGAQTLTGNEVSLLCDELGTKGQAPKNPKAKELLEGKAFFKVISGIMHNMRVPGVPPNPVHEASLQQQERCADTLNTMFTWNEAGGGSVSFPTWKVHVGVFASLDQYLAPNAFCYTTSCLDEFVSHVTSGGGNFMGKLVKSPNMGNPQNDKACGQAYAACLPAPTRIPPACTMPACGWDGKEWDASTVPGPPENKPSGD